MEAKLSRLSLDARPRQSVATPQANGKAPVADSWDEESVSEPDTETEDSSVRQKLAVPSAPPPTPISPSIYPAWDSGLGSPGAGYGAASARDRGEEERRRPEKSTAVAGRLIAGALGVKAPKKTEEQRAYERAMKEQEIKRKNRSKAAQQKEKEEAERAKSAVWDG